MGSGSLEVPFSVLVPSCDNQEQLNRFFHAVMLFAVYVRSTSVIDCNRCCVPALERTSGQGTHPGSEDGLEPDGFGTQAGEAGQGPRPARRSDDLSAVRAVVRLAAGTGGLPGHPD